jgi:diguanylate cyclase (GGDEF)-like protein/PAS domain S-box-containing protein
LRPLPRPVQRALLVGMLLGVLAVAVTQAPATLAWAGLFVIAALGYLFYRQLTWLRHSEERLTGLFRNSPVPAAVTRIQDGQILEANEAFLEMTGYRREQLIGRTSVEVGFWDSAQRRAAGVQELKRRGRMRDLEAPFRRASGELAFGIFHLELIELEGERRVVMTVQDISERRRAQERLRNSEELLSATGRMARVGGWELDLATYGLTWSEEVYRIHELDRSVRLSLPAALDFYAPEARPVIQGLVERTIQTGDPFDVRLPLITARGRRIQVRAIGQAELRDGKPMRLHGAFQDVTEEHQAAEQLELLSERVLLATRAADAGIWDWDTQRQELVWDDGMYRLYGVRPDEFDDPRQAWERVIHPEDRARVEAVREEAKAGKPYEIEFRVVRPDGALRYVKSYAQAQRSDDGKLLRLTGINLDVTGRREIEEALRASQTFLSALINNTDDLILASDRELRITLMNDAFRRAIPRGFGFALEEGDSLERIVLPERRDELHRIFARVLDGERQRTESVSRLPNGKVVYQDEAFNPVRDGGGQVTGISIFIHDVTQRRHTEQTIQRIVKATASAVGEPFFKSLVHELAAALETRYACVCELAPEGHMRTVAVSGDGGIVENFTYALAGTPCEQVLRSGLEFYPREVRTFFPDDRALADLAVESYLGVALHTASGEPMGLLAVLHDRPLAASDLARNLLSIVAARAGAELERLHMEAERQATLAALRQREATLQLAQQAGNAGAWDRDLTSERLFWSEAVYRMMHRDPSQFQPDRTSWLRDVVHPDDRARVRAASDRTIAEGNRLDIEHRIVLPDGSVRHVHQRGEVMRDEEGRPSRLIGIIQDITERTRSEEQVKASEERLRRLMETTHVVPWTFDPGEHRFTYVGPQIEKIVGYSADQWCAGSLWQDRLHPEDRAVAAQALRAQGDDREVEFRFQAADGHWVWLREMISSVPGREGQDTLQGFLMDVTDQKRAAEQLRLAAEVFQSSGEAIVISDAQLQIVTVNPAFTAITGYTPPEAEGRTPYELSRGVRSPDHDRDILNDVQRCGYWQGEVWDRRKSGDSYPKWLTLSAVRDVNGRIANYIEIFSDISERKEREERVRHLAHHDALTGLPNRVLLTDRITQAVAMAHRNETLVAVMFLDLDRFKNVNDSLGHSVGDKLLQEVAARLKAAMRASDTVSRLGGDEFVILMPEAADQAAIAVAARKVLEAVGRPYSIDGYELMSTPSLGISVFPGDGQDVETLLRNADAAMYHAKESGRNNYQFFTQDMNARALERLSLERSLRRALERDELRLHYQPQYELTTGRMIGVEALIRWEHPDEGLVSPARFMPFAEETGLILPIGAWVLERACWQNRHWQEAGLPEMRMSVNISALQFRQPGFADTVRHALLVSGLDARYLELEVTESVIMHDAERVTSALAELKRMGLELAIDDFGTGYSSLSYLKRFPIDRLKIDQSFVRDIPSDGEDAAIISAIIGLARDLGLRTIAEGVETAEQLEFLREHGCEEVQGYLLSRPLPPEACAKLLREGGVVPVLRAA